MRGLAPLAWRSLAARPLRSALTVAGIALGVGVLFASLATNAAIERSADRTVQEMLGNAQLRVSAFQESGLSAASVAAIASAPGVAAAAPAAERRTYLRPELNGALAAPVTVLGIDPAVDAGVHDYRVTSGTALAADGSATAVITERLARDDGYQLGSELTLQGAGEPERIRVIGIVAGDGPVPEAKGRTVIVSLAAVTRIFALPGVTRVDVRATNDVSVASVEQTLVDRLRAEPYVLSTATDLAASLRAATVEFQATMALIAAVALFSGAFLIFNTVSMTVAERVREVGLLRAAGATRRQVTQFVLVGAAVLGAIGAAAGLVVGLVLAAAIGGYIRSIAAVRTDDVGAPIAGLVAAFSVGFLVTLVAALEPAWRAGRIPPVDALKLRADSGGAPRWRLRWVFGVFAAVGILGLVAWPPGGSTSIVRGLAVYGVLLVATLLSPFVIAPIGRIAGLPFAALLRFEERIARRGLVRERGRTALTVGALAVGLAMIVAIGGVALNARHAAGAWLQSVVPGDEVLTSIRPVALDEPVVADLRAVGGVDRVSPVATFDLAYRGGRVNAAAIVGADFLADGRLRFIAGDRIAALRALDAGGTAVLAASEADRLGARVGDVLPFAVGSGRTVSLTVAGIAEHTLPGATGEAILVSWTDATTSFGVLGADFLAVRFAGTATSRSELDRVAREAALEPTSLEGVQTAVADALGRVFGLFDALALVAVLVAALGIVNTLTMNVVERVREIGVLRATGMTRRQVGRMVVVEAGILGLVGAILGAVTGLVVGVVMVVLAGGRIDVTIDVPWTAIALCVVLGVGVSMAAAWYPARLASRLSIVRAVQFE